MVRLQQRSPLSFIIARVGFQSHYGAIATFVVVQVVQVRVVHFNPTMVRLRPDVPAEVVECAVSHFNPTMVRLRQWEEAFEKDKREGISIPLWCDCDSIKDW